MMKMAVKAFAVFDLAVSEAKADIVYLAQNRYANGGIQRPRCQPSIPINEEMCATWGDRHGDTRHICGYRAASEASAGALP